jgi:hypothetical protein
VTAGPAEAFAVVIQVYRDLGIAGELDANDVLLDTKNIANASVGSQQVILPSITDGVILVAKSPAGCFDRVIALSTPFSTLPVHLVSFQGNMDKNNKVTLNWTVADNETVNKFEIQRSTNGKDFSTVAIVFGTEKMGTEKYMYYETNNSTDKVMYRLKMTDKGNDADYSKILVFQSKSTASKDIKIIGNPVADKLTFSFSSNSTQVVDVKIYEVTGKLIMKHKLNSFEGNNTMSLPLNSTLKPGMYVVEVSDGSDYQVAKFIKR